MTAHSPPLLKHVLSKRRTAKMMTAPQPLAHDVSLVDAVQAVRERIRFALGLTAVIFLVMSLGILTDEPVYRAYVTLAPAMPLVNPAPTSVADGLLDLGDTGNIGVFQARTSANHAFALLRSRAISRRFIETEGLLPILFADQWDPEKQTWRESDSSRQPTLSDALRLFEQEVRFMSKSDSTGFIRVNIEWSDPGLAADWANRLVAMTDTLIREQDIEEARQSIRYLEQQAQNAQLESIKLLLYKLMESHAKTIMLAKVKDAYVFTVVDPAVAPQSNDTINMPVSFKLSLALIFSMGCSILWVLLASQFRNRRA